MGSHVVGLEIEVVELWVHIGNRCIESNWVSLHSFVACVASYLT